MKAPRINRQRGFLSISNGEFAVLIAMIAVCGWALIEGLRWVVSHLSFSFVP